MQSNATDERRRGISMVHHFEILANLKLLLRAIPKHTVTPDTFIGGVDQAAWDSMCDSFQDTANYRH